jgi:hypothetical protein
MGARIAFIASQKDCVPDGIHIANVVKDELDRKSSRRVSDQAE